MSKYFEWECWRCHHKWVDDKYEPLKKCINCGKGGLLVTGLGEKPAIPRPKPRCKWHINKHCLYPKIGGPWVKCAGYDGCEGYEPPAPEAANQTEAPNKVGHFPKWRVDLEWIKPPVAANNAAEDYGSPDSPFPRWEAKTTGVSRLYNMTFDDWTQSFDSYAPTQILYDEMHRYIENKSKLTEDTTMSGNAYFCDTCRKAFPRDEVFTVHMHFRKDARNGDRDVEYTTTDAFICVGCFMEFRDACEPFKFPWKQFPPQDDD